VAPARVQLSRGTFGGLPFWADSALVVSGLGQRFILSSQLNPIYEFGDFDGDGLRDLAVQIKDTGGLLYISQPDAPSGWVMWDGRDYVWIDGE